MEHKTYTYENSRRLFERALKVIPSGVYGHQGPAEGCFIPVDAFPVLFRAGAGRLFLGRRRQPLHRLYVRLRTEYLGATATPTLTRPPAGSARRRTASPRPRP